MVKEHLLFKMDLNIKGNLKIMLLMDLEHIFIQMANNIKVKYCIFIVILRIMAKKSEAWIWENYLQRWQIF